MNEQVSAWFAQRGWQPFSFQEQVWQRYLAGESGLVQIPTGVGKTYAIWFGPILEWLQENTRAESEKNFEPLRVLWLTPMRALANDTAEALALPVKELALPWSIGVRTGDSSSAVRAKQNKRLPTVLITTPESLSLLLTRSDCKSFFTHLRLVVVDEWHELMGSKRGAQTELALARLRKFSPTLRTWGLSATLGNADEALNALIGLPNRNAPTTTVGSVVSAPIIKQLDIASRLPREIEHFPWAGHLGLKLLPDVIQEIDQSGSTLVFTNTRSQTEQWYQAILEARPEWAGEIALHHGSLDRAQRSWVEQGVRSGQLRCVICTSSLDLGVDFSPVQRVIQIGSPKGVARIIQRAGRSGHQPGAVSKITCVPTHAWELIEIAAVRDAIKQGKIEKRPLIKKPFDVLAQHIVTVALGGGFLAEDLYDEVRSAHAYRDLAMNEWQDALDFVVKGGKALTAYPEYHKVVQRDGVFRVENKQIAYRHRMTVGTILGDAAMQVKWLRGRSLGTVEETFIAKLKPADRFIFAGRVLQLVRVKDMTAYVRRAATSQGAVVRWMGARMPLSTELAAAVRRKLEEARNGLFNGSEMLCARPILELQMKWSRLPQHNELLIEQVKTREGYHLFFYPFEGRLVHEGLAALLAYRLSRIYPISFTISINDYGFELLAPTLPPIDQGLADGLFSSADLREDILRSLNATELGRRQFREIARIAGLIFQGYSGSNKSIRQIQASSGLFYDVLERWDPQNLLLKQAQNEVLERQLEFSRLENTLGKIAQQKITLVHPKRPTPLGFPLMIDRMRQRLSSEKLADRVLRMQIQLEKAANR